MTFLPTRRLFFLLLGVAGPLLLATLWRGFLALAVIWLLLVVALVLLDVLRAPDAADIEVRRLHDPRLSISEDNPVELAVRWHAPPGAPRRLLARDETPFGLLADRTVLSGTLDPGGEWHGRYYLTPRRRGEYPFGDTVLRIETTRGLLLWQHAFPAEDTARVYPNIRAVRRYELLARQGRLQEVGLRRSRLTGAGTEFERLREYQPDDDVRRVNWKATARRGQPVSMVYETERSQNLVLVLDTGRLMATPIGELLKLDHAANAALLLAWVGMELGDRIALATFADRVETFVSPGRGRRHFQTIVETLYRLPAQPIEPDPVRALAEIARRQTKRALIVLFTDLAEVVEAERLVAALALLARRHLPVCVLIANPDINRLGALVPDDSAKAYEKVVAQRLLDERRAVVERMERAGALVLEAPVEGLTASVINRYLEIKARTRL